MVGFVLAVAWFYLLARTDSPLAHKPPGWGVRLADAAGLSWLVPPNLQRVEQHSSLVLDRHDRLLRAFPTAHGAWRLPTRAGDVDPLYLAMLKASEDQRFDSHLGVDPLAVLRAIGQMLASGRVVSGASTLTMQAARLLQPKPRTLGNKLREVGRALQLGLRYGRSGVLDVYLTLAPFGGAIEGVSAASLAWFGHPPDRLSPAEAALLVALPQAPERLRPDRHPEAARAARNRILERVAARGVIPADVAQAAQAEPVPRLRHPMPRLAPHLGEALVAGAPGRVVRTHLDARQQAALEALGRDWLAKLEPGSDLAVVVLDGTRLLAHLGSADWQARKLDLSRALRSPGSALKPFVYALAFDDLALHPATLMEDAPRRFGDWQPRNFDQRFHGTVTARAALQRSLNIPAVQALERVGAARFTALLRQCGVRLEFPGRADPGLPLALGGVGIRLTDLALLYAALGQGGQVEPIAIVRSAEPAAPPSCRLVGETSARVVLEILADSPMPEGMAAASETLRPHRVAFKTGTSYGYRDAWTVGVASGYTVAVWMGRADGGAVSGALGRLTAAPLMFRVFDLLAPGRSLSAGDADPEHPLMQAAAPPGLARLDVEPAAAQQVPRLRILFPPDGSSVEPLDEGIALRAHGGSPPLRWVVNGTPLPDEARFWQPEGGGFARLVVLDREGHRAESRIRVVGRE